MSDKPPEEPTGPKKGEGDKQSAEDGNPPSGEQKTGSSEEFAKKEKYEPLVLPGPQEDTKKDNTSSYFIPPDSRWSGFDLFSEAAGQETSGAKQAHPDWWTNASNANVVVIAGQHRESAQWAAETFAHHWKPWKELRRTSNTVIGGTLIEELIEEDLLGWEGRCLIVDLWHHLASEQRLSSLSSLKTIVQRHAGKKFGLVFWTHEISVRDRVDWPDNVHRYYLRGHSAEATPLHEITLDAFRQLFGHGLASIEEVAKLQRQTIEQALVRICVLFGDLPEGDLEGLLLAVLGKQSVKLAAEPGAKTRDRQSFVELWRVGKAFFLQRSGLVCRTEETPCRVGFASAEIRAHAAQVAWSDAQPMAEIFSAINEGMILFSDESTRHRRDLYEGYVSAAVMLARRAPNLYGAQWLESISVQYAVWVASEAPEIDVATHRDLLSILRVVAESEQHFARLRRRFAERMSYLCRHLAERSLPIVEDFFNRLAAKGLHSWLWLLVLELRGTKLDFARWTTRILNEGSDSASYALRQMAALSVTSRKSAQDFHTALAGNLSAERRAPKNPAERAAIAFPALVLEAWFRRSENAGAPAASLAEFLGLTLVAGKTTYSTIGDYWAAALSSKEFDQAIRAWNGDDDEEERIEHLPLAFALFQGVSLAVSAEISPFLAVAKEVRKADTVRWRSLCDHWRVFASIITDKLRALSQKEEDQEERLYLNQVRSAGQRLMSL